MSLYNLKPAFQRLLRPLVGRLAAAGVSANQVTLLAAGGSVLLGAVLALHGANQRILFLLLPLWLLIRMALNAIDGMLAREHAQASRLGAFLNEIGDIVSDAALIMPFAFVAPFTLAPVAAIAVMAAASEFAGLLGPLGLTPGASRRYDGPMGKSDRAFVFGALGLATGIFAALPEWLVVLMPALAALLAVTIINRVRRGLAEARE